MADGTTERVLRLLGLLQERRTWTGPELASELGVTDRCVRRDVMRLRDLGYPVNASQGVGGGYQLGAGTALPPLLLDADEAIATTVSLLLAAGGTVTGAADATLRTLAKLDQVLPPRLRAEVRAIVDTTATLDGGAGATVDGGDLMRLARATRDRVRVRFAYAGGDGRRTERDVEPSGLVATGRRWYLLAWDTARDDWRTFRLDRLTDLAVTTWTAGRPAHPDPAAYVQRTVTTAPYRHHARVRLALPPDEARGLFTPGTAVVEPDPEPGWCQVVAGADDLEWLALRFAEVDAAVEVLEPDALRTAAARVAERLRAMAG